jgi:hypothetical protein
MGGTSTRTAGVRVANLDDIVYSGSRATLESEVDVIERTTD